MSEGTYPDDFNMSLRILQLRVHSTDISSSVYNNH